MRTTLALSLCLIAAAGCVTFDNDGEGADEPDTVRDDDGLVDTGADPAIALDFQPGQAEQGELFIGYLTVSDGDLDLTTVSEVKFYGDLDLQSWDNRGNEIVVSLAVPEQATTGEVDLVLILNDQETVWLEAALTIYQAGSGNSAEGGYDDPTDGVRHTDCDE